MWCISSSKAIAIYSKGSGPYDTCTASVLFEYGVYKGSRLTFLWCGMRFVLCINYYATRSRSLHTRGHVHIAP